MSGSGKRSKKGDRIRRSPTGFTWPWRIVTLACLLLIAGSVAYFASGANWGNGNGQFPYQLEALAEGAQVKATPAATETALPESTSAPEATPSEAVAPAATLDANATAEQAVPTTAVEMTHEWPKAAFPDIPAMDAASLDVSSSDGYADIYLPAGADAGFEAYEQALVEAGADIYVTADHLKVLRLGDVEIQLISGDRPLISLCGEPAITWDGSEAANYPLPEAGRLVAVEETDEGTALTIRCASYHDLMQYLDLLVRRGWYAADSTAPVAGAMYYTTYKKADRAITIDYYVNTADFTLVMGKAAAQ